MTGGWLGLGFPGLLNSVLKVLHPGNPLSLVTPLGLAAGISGQGRNMVDSCSVPLLGPAHCLGWVTRLLSSPHGCGHLQHFVACASCLTPGRNALGPQCAEGQGLDGDLSRRTEQQGKGEEFAAKTPPCLPPTVGPTHPTVPGHCRRLSSPRWLQCLARQKGLGDSGVEDPSPSVAPHPAS